MVGSCAAYASVENKGVAASVMSYLCIRAACAVRVGIDKNRTKGQVFGPFSVRVGAFCLVGVCAVASWLWFLASFRCLSRVGDVMPRDSCVPRITW